MFIVERRMPTVSVADLAMLQEALVFVSDRLTSRRSGPVRRLEPMSTQGPTACSRAAG